MSTKMQFQIAKSDAAGIRTADQSLLQIRALRRTTDMHIDRGRESTGSKAAATYKKDV